MTSVIQHPYGESDSDKVDSPFSQGDNGYLGYIGPIGCKEGSTCQSSGAISHNEFIMIGDGNPIYNSTHFSMHQVHIPRTEAMESENIGSSWVKIGDIKYNTGFVTILRTNDEVGDQVFGRSVDQNMGTIMAYPQDEDGFELAFAEPTSEIKVSQNPDFTSMLKNDAEGRESDYVMFTHFENPRPSVIYRLNVDLANDCSIQVKSIEPVDASEFGGAYPYCLYHNYIVSIPGISYLRVFTHLSLL